MTTMARTDHHRPSAPDFDPESYEFTGVVFDAGADWPQANDEFRAVRAELIEDGYTFSGVHGGTGQCDHCGARLRYSALIRQHHTHKLVFLCPQRSEKKQCPLFTMVASESPEVSCPPKLSRQNVHYESPECGQTVTPLFSMLLVKKHSLCCVVLLCSLV